ncbi:MAG TPA: DUF4175 family protein [Rhodanobacteraceae bacterium]|nr:DUF4175 family protein [Rhodanobacteraceae bacterium]
MTLDARLNALGRRARHRRGAIAVLAGAPVVIASVVWAWRVGSWPGAAVAGIAGLILLAAGARHAIRSIDPAWIARRLDAADAGLEDSADLLFDDASRLTPLQALQRARVQRRIESHSVVDIAPPWPRHALAATMAVSLLAIGLAVRMPPTSSRDAGADAARKPANATSTQIDRIRLDVAPPRYTQLAPRRESELEAQVPEGSRVGWRLHFAPMPSAAALAFHDGSRVELARDGGDWIGERTLAASTLYRIVLDGAPPLEDDRLRRLDVVADRAPDVRVIEPGKTLTLLADGQRTWDLAFEAGDDYGIAAASLTITLAQGTGENIAFKEETLALAGDELDPASPGRRERYRHTLDLGTLGIARGDDVIVRLAVSDNREPKPNTTKSASFILRWPPESSSDSVGMEGLVEKAMPAYFRSQRQIIIDTEKLVAEQPALAENALLARSDGIGVDQKILRLRYGQFLGEESETRSDGAPPGEDRKRATNDADAGRADALTRREEEHRHFIDAEKFGDAGAVTAEYGHTHDVAEAATLLDPETKSILKSALDAMWEAELHLRQGHPSEALPHENTALAYIKQVQQSSRIYLARVGLELPAVDEARRLSGDRKGVSDRESSLVPEIADSGALAAWKALDGGAPPDLDALERWVNAHESASGDSLALLAAIDRVRREVACDECRRQLRSLLWPLLPRPAAGIEARVVPDASGRAYLEALRVEGGAPR